MLISEQIVKYHKKKEEKEEERNHIIELELNVIFTKNKEMKIYENKQKKIIA